MNVTNLHQAKAHLSRLIDLAIAGEEIIIARAGKPMVKLTPCQTDDSPRPLGLWKDKGVWIAADFDAPHPGWDVRTLSESDF